MKRVVSVSIGSAKRDKVVEIEVLGETVRLERIGTSGDFNLALSKIKELDGHVDAIGLGGIDIYLFVGGKRYIIKDGMRLKNAAKITPVVDGSGLKNSLEREAIKYLKENTDIIKPNKNVLLVSAADRFGMAEAFVDAGCNIIFGDLIFSLGIPVPITTIKNANRLAKILLPILTRLPFQIMYPTGKKQEEITPRFEKYYKWADIIAGDFHLIKRYLPPDMKGKIIITNTTTQEDVELLRERDIDTLITTTPEIQGRSFGTNVIEAMIIAITGKKPEELTPSNYLEILRRIGFNIRIEKLVKI